MNDIEVGPEAPAQDPLLIFLHVPKTAGTTLWLTLRRQYSPEATLRHDGPTPFAGMTPEQARVMRVLLGHFPHGVHQASPDPERPVRYITVLRDPVERVLSSYCHELRDALAATRSARQGERVPCLTLREYLNTDAGRLDNCQTRMLAGPEAFSAAPGACDRAAFERAKRNLETQFAVAGLTERYDETVVLLQRRFGWDMPCYVRENVGANRIRQSQVPADLMEIIQERTRWDRELYAFVAARFEAQIAREEAGFREAVRRFRRANSQYGAMKAVVGWTPVRALKSRLRLTQQMRLETGVRTALGALGLLGPNLFHRS